MKLAILLLILLLASTYAPQPKATITVFSNGYAQVSENVSVIAFSPVNVTLIGKPSDLTATYSNGSPVLYSISNGNLTAIPDANGTMDISYFTYSIVGKNNVSWFISIDTPYVTKVILPSNASLISINAMPSEVGQTGLSIYLVLKPGNWSISYIIPPPSVKVTTARPSSAGLEEPGIIAAIVIIAAVSAYILIRRKRSPAVETRELDSQIINFLKSKGGSAKESEIRQKLVIPKTSAWRAIKRLEREGRVKVVKVDRENVIYLV